MNLSSGTSVFNLIQYVIELLFFRKMPKDCKHTQTSPLLLFSPPLSPSLLLTPLFSILSSMALRLPRWHCLLYERNCVLVLRALTHVQTVSTVRCFALIVVYFEVLPLHTASLAPSSIKFRQFTALKSIENQFHLTKS